MEFSSLSKTFNSPDIPMGVAIGKIRFKITI